MSFTGVPLDPPLEEDDEDEEEDEEDDEELDGAPSSTLDPSSGDAAGGVLPPGIGPGSAPPLHAARSRDEAKKKEGRIAVR